MTPNTKKPKSKYIEEFMQEIEATLREGSFLREPEDQRFLDSRIACMVGLNKATIHCEIMRVSTYPFSSGWWETTLEDMEQYLPQAASEIEEYLADLKDLGLIKMESGENGILRLRIDEENTEAILDLWAHHGEPIGYLDSDLSDLEPDELEQVKRHTAFMKSWMERE